MAISGAVYEGEWHQGRRQGFGVFRIESGASYDMSYEGEFEEPMGVAVGADEDEHESPISLHEVYPHP